MPARIKAVIKTLGGVMKYKHKVDMDWYPSFFLAWSVSPYLFLLILTLNCTYYTRDGAI